MATNVLIVLLLLGVTCGTFGQNTNLKFEFPPINPETEQQLGRIVSYAIVEKYEEIISNLNLSNELPNFQNLNFDEINPNAVIDLPKIPGLPDFIYPWDLILYEKSDGPSSGILVGNVHICDILLSGLDTHNHYVEYTIASSNPLLIKLKYHFNVIPSVVGTHSIAARILEDVLNIDSYGNFSLDIDALFWELHVDVGLDAKAFLEVKTTGIDLGFKNISIFADDSIWNGKKVDWPIVSAEILETFIALWPVARPLLNGYIDPIITPILNSVVSNCGLQDVLDMIKGDFSCLSTPRDKSKMLEIEANNLLSKFNYKSLLNIDEKCVKRYPLPPIKVPVKPPPPKDENKGNSSALTQFNFNTLVTLLTATVVFNFVLN